MKLNSCQKDKEELERENTMLRQHVAEASQRGKNAEQKAKELQRALNEAKEQALKENEAFSRELTAAKSALERTSAQASVQLCNAYVQKESLRHGALMAGQVASRIVAADEGNRLLSLVKKDFANYVSVGKLMAADWAKSQGCDFDFSSIDVDSSEGFEKAEAKVTEDLKMLKVLPAEAKNFNSFPKTSLLPLCLFPWKTMLEPAYPPRSYPPSLI